MRQRDDLGPTAWNCHLHPSLRFSGSPNHLIHTFLAVASLGNLCPPKLLHLGTQHSVPRLFLLRLSMPPTATHQQDNSYGRSAIWRVSKFVIPLIPMVRRYSNYYRNSTIIANFIPETTVITFRPIHNMDLNAFHMDLANSNLAGANRSFQQNTEPNSR